MKVEIAFNPEKARNLSFQSPFPINTKCCRCKGQARLAFVAHETGPLPKNWKTRNWAVYHLYSNKGKGNFWLHDCCVVAVYFCRECLQPTALYNQA